MSIGSLQCWPSVAFYSFSYKVFYWQKMYEMGGILLDDVNIDRILSAIYCMSGYTGYDFSGRRTSERTSGQ